jgi:hypothetical protein
MANISFFELILILLVVAVIVQFLVSAVRLIFERIFERRNKQGLEKRLATLEKLVQQLLQEKS